MFGSFVKFVVTVNLLECGLQSEQLRLESEPSNGLPAFLKEKTRKDRLYNEVIKFLANNNVGWCDPEFGKPFICDLSNVLWYIDGHHEVLASRSCPIPSLFKSFVGFNKPELSKHRKRSISNMSKDKLVEYSTVLQNYVVSSWIQQAEWSFLKEGLVTLVESLASYASYLSMRNKAMKLHHSSPEPSVSFSDAQSIKFIKSSSDMSPLLTELNTAIKSSPYYTRIFVNDYTPDDKRRRYLFMRELDKGVSEPTYLFTYTHPSNVGNYHFIWKVPSSVADMGNSSDNLRLIEEIKKEIPVYHTRAMKKEFLTLYGRISPESKPYLLRSMYYALTKDSSAPRTTAEREIDERVQEALLAEDIDIIIDLRHLNSSSEDNFSLFWAKCNEYLTTCTTVHERRHDTVSFMAKAISVRDLIEQVSKMCPEGTPIPSESWMRFNFFPRNPHTVTAKRYRKQLQAKHVIQKRQFRKTHIDAHYCAALFRYMREYAVKLRSVALFVCLDDKHRIKVGEPGFPLAAVERGREVIVSLNETFCVGDHDFSKFSLIPSVTLLVDIPVTMTGSWYRGQVHIGIKDAIFEPSSPLRHATELYHYLLPNMVGRHALFIYSDGGPDHRLTYVSVQLSLMALFLNLDLDLLVAARTAPSHSWANPVERVMSTINLGLQCVGVMRKKMEDEDEKVFERSKNLKELRANCIDHKDAVAQTLQPVKDLIASILQRLELKEKKFTIFQSASEWQIEQFWEILLQVSKNDHFIVVMHGMVIVIFTQ